MGSIRAVTRLWVLAESLAVLVPWLSFVDTSLDNGLLSAAKLHLRKPAQLGAERWAVVGFVATQKPPMGTEGWRGLLAGNALASCTPLTHRPG